MAKNKTTSKTTKVVNKNDKPVNKPNVPAKEVETVETVKVPKNEEKVIERKKEIKKTSTNSNVITLSKKTAVCFVIIVAILIVSVVLLVVSKHIPKIKDGSEVIASVDGKTITADDLYEYLKNNYGTNEILNMLDGYIADKEIEVDDKVKEYVDGVVDYYKEYAEYYGVSFDEFLAQYLGISGVTDEDSFYDYVLNDYKKQLALVRYVGSTLSEDEINKYYEANYSKKYTVKHILIEVEDDDDAAAKKEAKDLIKKLKDKKDDSEELNKLFDELAKKHSADTANYNNGGLMEDITESKVVKEFWKAVEEMKDGELSSEPVKTDYGYHVILKVSTTEKQNLEDVLDEVKEGAATEKLTVDSNLQITAMNDLRKKYNLKFEDTAVKEAYDEMIENASNAEETTEETEKETEK